MQTLELIEIGDELGIILPDEVLAKLNVGLGDEIYLTEIDNGFTLTNAFETQPKIGRELMKEQHAVLRADVQAASRSKG